MARGIKYFVRVNEAEHEQLQQKADSLGLSIPSYLRVVGLGNQILRFTDPRLPEHTSRDQTSEAS